MFQTTKQSSAADQAYVSQVATNVGLPVPGSPLELRVGAIRTLACTLTEEISELRGKLAPLLAPEVPTKVATVSGEPQGSTPAPLIMMLGEIEDQLRRIKDELHMIRCRACC